MWLNRLAVENTFLELNQKMISVRYLLETMLIFIIFNEYRKINISATTALTSKATFGSFDCLSAIITYA